MPEKGDIVSFRESVIKSSHMAANEPADKGDLYTTNDAGYLVKLTDDAVVTNGVLQVLESKPPEGTAGTVKVQCFMGGSRCLVTMGADVRKNQKVKLDVPTTDPYSGEQVLIPANTADIALGKVIGTFLYIVGRKFTEKTTLGNLGVVKLGV